MTIESSSPSFFENIYQASEDPWSFASSEYERNRYAAILDALNGRCYCNTFEPACSVGVLTSQLALISKQVYAMDISPTAIARGRERCQHLSNVSISCGALPMDIPAMSFDLIVFSEIGYYFDEATLCTLVQNMVERMEQNGTFLAAHWLGSSPDHTLGGDQVHEVLKSINRLEHEFGQRHSGFRLDRWVRR